LGNSNRATRRRRRRARHGTENDLDPRSAKILIAQFNHLVETLLPQARLRSLEELVLTFDNWPADGSLSPLIALDAFLERDIEKQDHARHPVSPRQFQEILAGLRRECGGIDHAKPVRAQALLDEEMNELEGLRTEALVALVVAYAPARPVGGNHLRGPEVALRESGLSASCGPTKHHHRRPNQSDGFFCRPICIEALFFNHVLLGPLWPEV
jgi:hypothetical protein